MGNRENYVNYVNMLCYLDHLTSVFYLYLVAICKAFFNSLRFSFLFVNCVIHLLVLLRHARLAVQLFAGQTIQLLYFCTKNKVIVVFVVVVVVVKRTGGI